MADYSGVKYRMGQEGFLVMGGETGMLAPNATALGTLPTVEMVGVTNVPSFSGEVSPKRRRRGAGSYSLLGVGYGTRGPSVRCGGVLSSGTAGVRKLLKSAMRNQSSGGFAGKYLCQPVICLGGGAVGACDAARSYFKLLRYGMINTYSVTFRPGQDVMFSVEAWGLAVDRTQAALTGSTVSTAAIQTAAGIGFSFEHMYLKIPTINYQNMVTGMTITGNNNLSRTAAARPPSVTGTTDPLSYTSRSIQPGQEEVTIALELADELPSALAYGLNTIDDSLGPVTVGCDDGQSDILEFVIATNYLDDFAQNETDAAAPFGFTASVLSGGITIT